MSAENIGLYFNANMPLNCISKFCASETLGFVQKTIKTATTAVDDAVVFPNLDFLLYFFKDTTTILRPGSRADARAYSISVLNVDEVFSDSSESSALSSSDEKSSDEESSDSESDEDEGEENEEEVVPPPPRPVVEVTAAFRYICLA